MSGYWRHFRTNSGESPAPSIGDSSGSLKALYWLGLLFFIVGVVLNVRIMDELLNQAIQFENDELPTKTFEVADVAHIFTKKPIKRDFFNALGDVGYCNGYTHLKPFKNCSCRWYDNISQIIQHQNHCMAYRKIEYIWLYCRGCIQLIRHRFTWFTAKLRKTRIEWCALPHLKQETFSSI